MAKHRRTANRSNSISGRVKIATVAAATGAILIGGAQFGAASAAARPLEIPPGLLPAGVQLPAIELPDLPAAPPAPGTPGPVNPGSPAPLKVRAVQPVSGTLSSGYGPRWGAHHGGIDIAAPIGTPIQSAADGEVISAGPASGFGLWVRVRHDDGAVSVYGHINEFIVNVGQRVAAGQQIATVGNRGQSTGPHLHFEVSDAGGNRLNPSQWLRDRGVSVTWGAD
ncbi:M23 family metallopeptidase (plasmid) [Rhodococcus opacus]|uniref:M23 family metallopeptidase n=1 Tax=Rhodococcus TaxID=1827 RepID=UPI00142091B1|nr:M23 family metallopeptidase [Rhodococcus opacus]MDV6245380.1 M23 family metallopeptidase [Rhodococcus opacus]NHU49240.1 M23 family metallopeptidase [Rhodococcus sp. A14]WKN60318.1 M23 family metallopeptidase [Rhodococcus opacus]